MMSNSKPNTSFLIPITLTVTLGGFLFGYDTAVISGTVSSLKAFFVTPYGMGETAENVFLGFVVSSALTGCVLGGILGGWVSKRFGRREGLILAALLFLISALGSAMPEIPTKVIGTADHQQVYWFIMYRVLGGIGIGLASMLSPMYIAEIAPADRRGQLVSLNQFAIVSGILIVYFVNYYIAGRGDEQWLNSVGWRWMFASEAIPSLIFLIALFFIPDTPRSLLLKGQQKKAAEVLNKINGVEATSRILGEIKGSLQDTSTKLFSFGFMIIAIGVLLAVLQQCCIMLLRFLKPWEVVLMQQCCKLL